MRRAWTIVVFGMLALAGCSGASTGGGAAGTTAPTGTAPAGAATGSTIPASGGDADVFLVQNAGAAVLGPVGADGKATLTLSEAGDRTIWFTGAAVPRVGSAPTAGVVEVLDDSTRTHDAALSWTAADERGTLVVALGSGTYDASAHTLTYQVEPLDPAEVGSKAVAAMDRTGGAVGGVTRQVPTGVTASTLFIDPVGEDRAVATCNLTVKNQSDATLEVTSVNSIDFGGMVDWDLELVKGQVIDSGASASADSGKSFVDCHAAVTFSVTAGGSSAQLDLFLEDSVFEASDWTCTATGLVTCDVDANAHGQPMNMTVTVTG